MRETGRRGPFPSEKLRPVRPGDRVGRPVLKELDSVIAKARRIQVTFQLRSSSDDDGELVAIDSSYLRYGWGVEVPDSIASPRTFCAGKSWAFSDAMLKLANVGRIGRCDLRRST